MQTTRPVRQTALTAVVFLALFLAFGGATAPAAAQENGTVAEADIVVTENGDIQEVQIRYHLDSGTYEEWQAAAREQGYDDPAKWYADRTQSSNPAYNGYRSADVRETSDGAVITVVYSDVDISESEDTTVSVEGDRVTVVTENVVDPDDSQNLAAVIYRYHMPGQIVDSNAIETDGNTAIWRLHNEYRPTLRIESGGGNQQSGDQQSEGWDVTYDIVVDSQGEIRETQVSFNVDSETYEQFRSTAQQDGYDSGAQWLAELFVDGNDEFVAVRTTSETSTAKGMRMTMAFQTDLRAAENVTTTVQGETVSVRHINIDDPQTQSSISTLTYRYHMPDQVVDSNAIETDGNTAIWRLHEQYQPTLRVESGGGSQSDDQQPQQSDGFDIEYDFTVTSDGEVRRGEVALDVTDSRYQELQQFAQQEGYDSTSEWLAATLVEEEDTFVDYANPRDENSAKGMRLAFTADVDISQSENITITAENGSVTVQAMNIEDPSTDPSIATVTQRFDMPGEIIETNAIETDGNTAIWRLHEQSPSELYVESRATNESDQEDNETEEDETETASEFGPGFGITAALVGLLLAALVFARRE